jgi:hypothetical protein
MKMKYLVRIYSGTPEDNELEFGSYMPKFPKTITWLKAPGFATIEKVKE